MVFEQSGGVLRARGEAFLHGNADRLKFPDRSGKVQNAKRIWSDLRGPGDLTWAGKIEGEDGTVVLTWKNGLLSGFLSSREGSFEVRTSSGGEVVLDPVNESKLGKCLTREGTLPVSQGSLNLLPYRAAAQALERAADDPAEISVVVVYTTGALEEAGGEEQILTKVQAAMDTMNLALKNSEVNAKVKLLGTAETEYVETETEKQSEYLSVLAADEKVQALREEVKADLIALLISKGEGEESGCGVGYLLTKANEENGKGGFSVTKLSCAIGGLTFAHELGHNMGLQHDPANGSKPESAYLPYAFGHFVDGSFRSVMSYANECKQECKRIPYFSSPDFLVDGQPLGIADERDNARVLRQTAPIVAKFR